MIAGRTKTRSNRESVRPWAQARRGQAPRLENARAALGFSQTIALLPPIAQDGKQCDAQLANAKCKIQCIDAQSANL